MAITEKAIEIAIKYWVNVIKSGDDHDNGDTSPASAIASILANNFSKNDILTEEQITTFKTELNNNIKQAIEKFPDFRIEMYSDYGPGWILRPAAEKAKINTMRFPWKTGVILECDTDIVIEMKPYNKQKFTQRILYASADAIKYLITEREKTIQHEQSGERKHSEFWTDNDSKQLVNSLKTEINDLNKLLQNNPNCYIRENLQ